MIQILQLTIGLFLSHILVDFYFQPTNWVRQKQQNKARAWQLYAHAALSGFLALVLVYLLTGKLVWLLLPLVAIPHYFIDLWKLIYGKTVVDFFIDQALHGCHLLVILAWLAEPVIMNEHLLYKIAIIACGALILWVPAGIMIGKLTQRFHQNLSSKDKKKALPEAGRWIGILERLFIFISILVGQFGAIGFLIAAKSILRFSDSRTVENPIRMSEYVLIGSLLSFLFAMVTALVCQFVIDLL